MVTMGIFPYQEKFPWQSWESNPNVQQSKKYREERKRY